MPYESTFWAPYLRHSGLNVQIASGPLRRLGRCFVARSAEMDLHMPPVEPFAVLLEENMTAVVAFELILSNLDLCGLLH